MNLFELKSDLENRAKRGLKRLFFWENPDRNSHLGKNERDNGVDPPTQDTWQTDLRKYPFFVPIVNFTVIILGDVGRTNVRAVDGFEGKKIQRKKSQKLKYKKNIRKFTKI